MSTEELYNLLPIKGDYENMTAKDFVDLVCNFLKVNGEIKREVLVDNRGDGRRGEIDIIFTYKGKEIAIEIDWKNPRAKSLFKVRQYGSEDAFVITRAPFNIIKV